MRGERRSGPASSRPSTGGAGVLLWPVLSLLLLVSYAEEEESRYGRLHSQHPVRHCCIGDACTAHSRSRHAFVTSLRTAGYLTGLRELHCSLAKTNPGVPLIIMGVAGDLDEGTIAEVEALGQYRVVEDIRFPNTRDGGRYTLNWVKLRAWQWVEFDALVLLDADVVVRGDLTHLFGLPTPFAWSSQNGHTGFTYNRGGVIMMRPCQPAFEAMMRVLLNNEYFQFRDELAEQDFLTWFFRYTAFDLPMRYNLNFDFLDLAQGLGPGGTEALALHFAHPEQKAMLFNATPGSPAWPYLCYQPGLLLTS